MHRLLVLQVVSQLLDDPHCSTSPYWREVRKMLDKNWTANVEIALKVNTQERCVLGGAAVTAWRFLGRRLSHDVDGALKELELMALLPVPAEYCLLPGWFVPHEEVVALRETVLREAQRQRTDLYAVQEVGRRDEMQIFVYEKAKSPFCESNFIYDWFRMSPFRTMNADTADFFLLQLCVIEDLYKLREEHMEHFLPTLGRDHVILLPLSVTNYTRPRFLARAIFLTPWGDAPSSAGTEIDPITLHDYEPHRDILIPLPFEFGRVTERTGTESAFCVVRELKSYVPALFGNCVVLQLGAFELPFGHLVEHKRFVVRVSAEHLDKLDSASPLDAIGMSADTLRRYQNNAREAACLHTYPNVYDNTSPCGERHALRAVEDILWQKIRKSKTAVGPVFYVEGKTFTSIDELDPERFT